MSYILTFRVGGSHQDDSCCDWIIVKFSRSLSLSRYPGDQGRRDVTGTGSPDSERKSFLMFGRRNCLKELRRSERMEAIDRSNLSLLFSLFPTEHLAHLSLAENSTGRDRD